MKAEKMTTERKEEIKFLLPGAEEWLDLNSTDKEEDSAKRSKEKLSQHILVAMQMQNIVVLSGCGTSLGNVNGPSMKDLWDKATKIEGDYPKEVSELLGEIGYDHSDEDAVNIEELLSLCEAHLEIKQDKAISDFVENCKKEILAACSFKKTDDQLFGHKTFIHRLSRRRVRDARLKIFTTNYDTCFEEAAGSLGIVIIDGFSFAKPRVYDPRFFDFDIVKRSGNTNLSDNYLEGVFQLYKLHGSVNWEHEDDGLIYEKDATPKGVRMIFPAKGKYQQSYIQPHLELMARYLAALREPNTCLLITGFGFNDSHLAEPIISAIKSNPYLKVIIADYSAAANITGTNDKASSYWQQLKTHHTNGEDVAFINCSFEEFANFIPDLRSLTPAEKVANAIKGITGE